MIDELIAQRLCVLFGELGLRKRSHSANFRTDADESAAVADFCALAGRRRPRDRAGEPRLGAVDGLAVLTA